MATETLDTYNKALSINLDTSIFGAFAEIGAGQETSRWFLRVGAASGTVAKTISAYDKVVSDDLYGAGGRYVSKERLEAILGAEWLALQRQLADRWTSTRAFVFANTVSARNYSGTNLCHGWIGLRFLRSPGAEVNEILLHVNLYDRTNILQQEVLGILGVNLIHAAFFQLEGHRPFLSALGHDLGLERIQIDFVETRGHMLEEWDQKELLIDLVACGLSEGVMLSSGDRQQPMNEVFYRAPVAIEPGTFEERERVHTKMLTVALKYSELRRPGETRGTLGLFCLSATQSDQRGGPLLSSDELLGRANALLAEGFDVLVTVHRELYKMSALISRFTKEQVRFVVGLSVLIKMLTTGYAELQGTILESLSRLFSQGVRLYVYPMTLQVLRSKVTPEQSAGWTISNAGGLLTADDVTPPLPLGHLYAYLLASGLMEPLPLVEPEGLLGAATS
jgi:hypothetical protein